MENEEWTPSIWFYAAMWGVLTILGGLQGWFTGEAVLQVYEWIAQLS